MQRILLATIILILTGCDNNTSKSSASKKEYIQLIEISSISSIKESNLNSLFNQGSIDLTTYQNAKDYIQEQNENRIRFMDFSRMDIYATEEGVFKSVILMKIDDVHEKNNIQNYIIYAYQDDRVINTRAIYSQGDTTILRGTLMTINPKYNDQGKVKGKMNRGRQIFIPNI